MTGNGDFCSQDGRAAQNANGSSVSTAVLVLWLWLFASCMFSWPLLSAAPRVACHLTLPSLIQFNACDLRITINVAL